MTLGDSFLYEQIVRGLKNGRFKHKTAHATYMVNNIVDTFVGH